MTKAEISFIRSLSSRSERSAAGLFVCEGVKLVSEIVASNLAVRKIYMVKGAYTGFTGCDAEYISASEMDRISSLKEPTPVLVVVEIPTHKEIDSDLVIALDDIQDPGNMGTIIRLADWFGIKDIVCSQSTVDCYNSKVVQATMGAIARVRVHYTDLQGYLKGAVGKGLPVYGTFLDGENIYGADLAPRGVIVMGNEGNGIGAKVIETVTNRLYIPPYPIGEPSSESLNVAVATAIVCSEFRRRMI